MLDLLAGIHATLELPPPALPASPSDPFPEQVEAVMESPTAHFQLHLRHPSPDVMKRLRSSGWSTR